MQYGLPWGHGRARSPVRPNFSHAVHSTVKEPRPFKCGLPLSRSTALLAMSVPGLTSFSGVQLNAQVFLPICEGDRMIGIRQLAFDKSILVFAARLKMRVKGINNSRISDSVKNTGR